MKLSRSGAWIVLTVVLFAACSKKDALTSGSISQTVSNDATTPDLSKCKIRRIYQDQQGQRVSALFSYNAVGNPYSVLYSNGGTGVPNYYFFYDKQNRLNELRLTWGFTPIEDHFYKYDQNNRIVTDSLRIYNGGDGTLGRINVSTIEYDAAGRVVRETIVNIFNGPDPLEKTRRPTFTYDNRGNLGVLGWKSSSYDYKVNPLRQNPIFQFVLRNYSMNNAAPQPKYNSLGLPLSINPSNDVFFNNLVTLQVVYDCQ